MPPKATGASTAAVSKKTPTRATTTRARKTTETSSTSSAPSISLSSIAKVSDHERLHMIAEAAYYRAEKRNFAPGHEAEDWAAAEREIDELVANAKRISGR
ncbi:MAG: DUF2934 domain-containing protein [Sphingobacteriia bacterium]|nr:DUF2934 domain-containing protein [Sphingobacteriia bacterium]NCC40008.1 DUF2934 domain-containing protein [Gammaproteobacteria bacterium]